MRLAIPLGLIIFSASILTGTEYTYAADTVFICTGKDGKKIWSNVECPDGHDVEAKTVDPNVLPSDGLRAWARRSPPRSDYNAKAEAERQASLAHAKRQEQMIRCENAKRDYSFESTWKSSRAKPMMKYEIMKKECQGL